MFDVNGVMKRIMFFDESDAGGGNPPETEEPKKPEEPTYIPPKGSGLEMAMREYLPVNDDDRNDFVIEGLDEDKAKLVREELAKENPSLDNLQDFSEEEKELIKDKFVSKSDDKDDDKNDEPSKLEEMDKDALIAEIKKNQRLVSERNAELEKFKARVEDADNPLPFDKNEVKDFFEGIKKDFKGTWEKHAEKFGLPDIELLTKVASQGSVEDRLLQWQDTELRKKIENEFKLEDGEFEIVKEDLYTPKTPSYRWRVLTEQKERELQNEVNNQMQARAEALKQTQQQQVEDVKWYAEKYLGGDEEEALKLVEEINNIPVKIKNGELPKEAHPFNVRNLLIAANYEKLVEAEVNKAVEDLTKEFNEKGMYLSSKEAPYDMTKNNGKPAETKRPIANEETAKFSPMLRTINQTIANI